jgi:hypothetical protein
LDLNPGSGHEKKSVLFTYLVGIKTLLLSAGGFLWDLEEREIKMNLL